MSLTGALHIGNSALTASQLAIQVAGNNMANAATPGYSRQLAYLSPLRSNTTGRVSIGMGVRVTDVRRQVDEALLARLNTGIAQEAAAQQRHTLLSQIESTLGELGDNDLSSEVSKFFGSWSERANLTQSSAVVVQQGQRLADFMRRLRSDLTQQRDQLDRQLGVATENANGVLDQIAQLNQSIADAEAGGGRASTLRDQRDTLVAQLSESLDATAVEQNNGMVNVLVGSTPIVLGARSRGIELVRRSQNGNLEVSVNVKEDGQQLTIDSGRIGALLSDRDAAISDTIGKLDTMSAQLIFEVNKLHSTGCNAAGLGGALSTLALPTADRTLALNDPANQSLAGLPFHATSGGFTVQVKSPTGSTQSVRIDIDLDGRTAAGLPGYGDDTSAEDIRAAVDAIDGLSASFTSDGRLKIDADAGFTFSFADDTSAALATLGVNAYFTGTNAADIAVRSDLREQPNLLTTGRMENGTFIENGTALGIAGLQDKPLNALGDRSIKTWWIDSAQALGVQTDAAKATAEATSIVRQSLDAQRLTISGVNIDEESVNLMTFQRQYQGAARFITTVDEMMQTLISIV